MDLNEVDFRLGNSQTPGGFFCKRCGAEIQNYPDPWSNGPKEAIERFRLGYYECPGCAKLLQFLGKEGFDTLQKMIDVKIDALRIEINRSIE